MLQSTVTAWLMEAGRPPTAALVLPLSPREREIVALLATGASNKEIADRLCLAEGSEEPRHQHPDPSSASR